MMEIDTRISIVLLSSNSKQTVMLELEPLLSLELSQINNMIAAVQSIFQSGDHNTWSPTI